MVEFDWHRGMAPSQKKKNIIALHQAAKNLGIHNLLEISSKSDEEVGQRLSAFSLKLKVGELQIPLECVYQGSKVFRNGGPFTDLFDTDPRHAKRDDRLQTSGQLLRFELGGHTYPLSPKNAFYDWLYIRTLFPHERWITDKVLFQGFTDIEFNPSRSINCQARAFAEFVSLTKRNQLNAAVRDFDYFASLLSPI